MSSDRATVTTAAERVKKEAGARVIEEARARVKKEAREKKEGRTRP